MRNKLQHVHGIGSGKCLYSESKNGIKEKVLSRFQRVDKNVAWNYKQNSYNFLFGFSFNKCS